MFSCCCPGGGLRRNKSIRNPDKVTFSDNLQFQVDKVFKKFDVDDSKEIDLDEAMGFFKGRFAKISAGKMFEDMDDNNDNLLQYSEWVYYFKRVVATNMYTEEEIIEELENMLEGEAVTQFETVVTNKCAGGRRTSLLEGKSKIN